MTTHPSLRRIGVLPCRAVGRYPGRQTARGAHGRLCCTCPHASVNAAAGAGRDNGTGLDPSGGRRGRAGLPVRRAGVFRPDRRGRPARPRQLLPRLPGRPGRRGSAHRHGAGRSAATLPGHGGQRGKGSPGIEEFATALPNGNALHMRLKDNRLLGFDLLRPGAVYPKPNTEQAWPRHAKAYDLALLPHRANREAAATAIRTPTDRRFSSGRICRSRRWLPGWREPCWWRDVIPVSGVRGEVNGTCWRRSGPAHRRLLSTAAERRASAPAIPAAERR